MSEKSNSSLGFAKASGPDVRRGRPRLSRTNTDDSVGYRTPSQSPSNEHHFVVPSPLPTRRTRTYSACRRATEGPVHYGECKFFSRSKGHGFVQPTDGSSNDLIFMHVSDIESEYIPMPGDTLSFKLSRIPPKNEKFQAVEVHILSLGNDSTEPKHTRWDGAPSHA